MIAFPQHPATGMPRIGEYWPGQGGIYAGIMPDYVGTQPRFLIFSADEAVDLPWGGFGSTEAGASNTDHGLYNTRHLTGCTQPLHAHDAANFAAEYEKDGHRDFYLPSKRELDVAYVTIADTFDGNDWYWSSTEASGTMAYGRNFGDVDLPSLFKHTKGRVRLVRSIPVASDTANASDKPDA
jgi:hypothetical protein